MKRKCNPVPVRFRVRGRPNFTLIELLAVVDIVALLAAMPMPALQQARESAKRGTCLSQNGQIGTALSSCCCDNEESFPLLHNEMRGKCSLPALSLLASAWAAVIRRITAQPLFLNGERDEIETGFPG
ncbi:MAG: hypothetical protein IJH79_05115 [Lentisphaeria bacterium]|nr:hypothetical protein [Lentisphaeria bacterium]MBQ9500777.1 hypothetical protein [Lentisphaeria bacterium]